MKINRIITIILWANIILMAPALAAELPKVDKVTSNSVLSVERRAAKVYTGTVLRIGGDSEREICVVPIYFSKNVIRDQAPISQPEMQEIFANAKKESEGGPFFLIEQMIAIKVESKEWYILFLDEGGGRFLIFRAEEIGDGVFTQGSPLP